MIDLERVRPIADAVLHEGAALFPYRPATKNRFRWTFGGLSAPGVEPGARTRLAMQCLVEAGPGAVVELLVRFLRQGDAELQEARIEAAPRTLAELATPAEWTAGFGVLEAAARLEAAEVATGVFRVTLLVENRSRVAATMESTQALLAVDGGAWVSPCDPPAGLEGLADACESDGAWPVLLGRPPERSLLMASPIVLPDHPEVAPESPGDLFDATENDELLSLAIRALGDDERDEAMAGEPRVRALLERTMTLGPEAMGALHGAVRARRSVPAAQPAVGTRVRLRPRGRGDLLDLALDGRSAHVVGHEQDLEGRRFVAVTVDDDPGRDLGVHGHRYFFAPDELEPVAERSVLVAGIGNVFFGDDGFGPEVIRALAGRSWPAGVEVRDFGIRVVDLGYALERCDAAILVDAMPRGAAPGTLVVLEVADLGGARPDPHGLSLDQVLAALPRGAGPRSVRIVGCEPAALGDPEGELGLSEPVRAAVAGAVAMVERLVAELRATEGDAGA